MTLEQISCNRSFGGEHRQYTHASAVLGCSMRFAVYLPPAALAGARVPLLYWLSGLTCSDENFMQKAGAQRVAAELGIAIVAPDTSPRGAEVADDPAYDLGQGAGFYLNATQAPWAAHYRMYDYVSQELPALLAGQLCLRPRGDCRAQHGRPRRAAVRAETAAGLCLGIGVQPDCQPGERAVGAEGVCSLPGRRLRHLAGVGRQRADGCGQPCHGAAVPGRRGAGRWLSR